MTENQGKDDILFQLSLKGAGLSMEKQISYKQAMEVIQITIAEKNGSGLSFNAQHGAAPANPPAPAFGATNETIGEFIARMGAKNKPEEIASIAYYLKHVNKTAEFSREDIKKYFKPAGLSIPQNIHRDFSLTIQERWIAEDTQNSGTFFITTTGETAVKNGFPRSEKAKTNRASPKSQKSTMKEKGSPNRTNAKILKDLDLTAKGGNPSLDEFFEQHNTAIDLKRNVVFAHYLSDVKGINPVTQDHIFTCYHHLKLPLPVSMTSSLKNSNATARGGYLMSSNPHDVKLSTQGLNLIRELQSKRKAA